MHYEYLILSATPIIFLWIITFLTLELEHRRDRDTTPTQGRPDLTPEAPDLLLTQATDPTQGQTGTQTQKGKIEMRRLTVIKRYYDNEFDKNSHGEIRIKGKWLFQYGFKPGDKVSVIPCEGQLIILKDERG